MIESAVCLENARECRALARTALTSQQRDILFEMARVWETMAKHAVRPEREPESEAGAKVGPPSLVVSSCSSAG
jgi:hypothetical protein